MESVATSPEELGNGLFGKVGTRGDFLRINVTGAALEMAAHLDDVVAVCHHAGYGVDLPDAFFVYHATAAATAIVGTLRPSSDNVGRSFPLAVFTQIEVESAAGNFDIVPLAFESFLAEAMALADDANTVDVEVLAERLASLSFPNLEEFEAAQTRGDALLVETTVGGFSEALFGSAVDEERYFAFHTVATACLESREQVDDEKTGITLDLPLSRPLDVVIWQGIVRRLLGEQSVCPNAVWTLPRSSPSFGSVKVVVPPTPGRLFISFGAPSPAVLASLAGVPNDSPKLWPARCSDAGAIEQVKALLTPEQLDVLDDPNTTLEAVVAAFGG